MAKLIALIVTFLASLIFQVRQVVPRVVEMVLVSPTPSAVPIVSDVEPVVTPEVIKPQATPRVEAGVISEGELWQALVVYRQAHRRNSVIREEALCRYARKRVTEHQERLKTLTENDSPLDHHVGFQRDGENGSLFSEIGGSFTYLAEVLAFIPQAQNATQVIEWGWDSSPAHREGLLSNDISHACVVGRAPFFVGILGRM